MLDANIIFAFIKFCTPILAAGVGSYFFGWRRGASHTWEQLEKRCGKDRFNSFVERNISDLQ